MQIGALALEERVSADGEKNVKVAGGPAAHARFAFTCKPDAGAILDSSRNVDRERALARHASRAGTRGTRVVDHLPAALAGRTRPLQREEPLRMADGALTGVLECGVAEAVVSGALVRVLEDFISLVDLLEADFATLVAGIAIGMPFHRELAEGRFQFTFVRGALDPQDV